MARSACSSCCPWPARRRVLELLRRAGAGRTSTSAAAQLATLRAEIDRGLAHGAPAAGSSVAEVGAARSAARPAARRAAGRAGRRRPAAPRAGDGDAVEPDDPRLHAAGRSRRSSCTPSGRSACSSKARYHDLGAFLERVSKFPRIINVGNLHDQRARRRRPRGRPITAECTATTFVLIEPRRPRRPACARGHAAAAAPRTDDSPCVCGRSCSSCCAARRRRAAARTRRRPRPAATAGTRRSRRRQSRDRPRRSRRASPTTPDGRRDPFVSLVRRGADVAARPLPARGRPGWPACGAAEVTPARHRWPAAAATSASLQGADNKTYIVRAGDQLLDGTVRDDHRRRDGHRAAGATTRSSLEKQREVRKAAPTDGQRPS